MKTSIVLSNADQIRLKQLLDHQGSGPWPTADQIDGLQAILASAKVTDTASILEDHVGIDDRVSLVSTADPEDSFEFQLVMPHDADVDLDRVSASMPVSLAVLGQRRGTVVSWSTPHGDREMKIAGIGKPAVGAPRALSTASS